MEKSLGQLIYGSDPIQGRKSKMNFDFAMGMTFDALKKPKREGLMKIKGSDISGVTKTDIVLSNAPEMFTREQIWNALVETNDKLCALEEKYQRAIDMHKQNANEDLERVRSSASKRSLWFLQEIGESY